MEILFFNEVYKEGGIEKWGRIKKQETLGIENDGENIYFIYSFLKKGGIEKGIEV